MNEQASAAMVPLETARWWLCAIWFGGAALIFGLLIVQSLMEVYEDKVQAVWGWALPNIVPTLSLMVGVLASTALVDTAAADSISVRRPFVWLAIGLSVFHLLCVALAILIQPALPSHAPGKPFDVVRSLATSNLWLGPLQGLVAGVLGTLFFTKAPRKRR